MLDITMYSYFCSGISHTVLYRYLNTLCGSTSHINCSPWLYGFLPWVIDKFHRGNFVGPGFACISPESIMAMLQILLLDSVKLYLES